MKKTSLKYGIRAGLLLVVLSWASFFVTKSSGVEIAQVASIAVILIALVFVPIAIRSERKRGGQSITFWKAFFTGALTSTVPAIFMFVSTIVFMMIQKAEYVEWSLNNTSPEISAGAEAVVMNPFEQGVIMFITVMMIGTIASLVSAILLQQTRSR